MVQPVQIGTQNALTFEEFLSLTRDVDRAFIGGGEERFLTVCCGMANGEGGRIVLGAERPEESEILGGGGEAGSFRIEGVEDAVRLERELRAALNDPNRIDVKLAVSFRVLSSEDKTLLVAEVEAADWFSRPVRAARAAYRRVDGNDVLCGRDVCFRLALDALELSRDDRPVPDYSVRELETEDLAAFRASILERHPRWADLSAGEFLKRALVTDDNEQVTRAGQLLLGEPTFPLKKNPPVHFIRWDGGRRGIQNFPNLWSACSRFLPNFAPDPLPGFLPPLSGDCAAAARECFLNALLHADYDAGRVEIVLREDTISFYSPGLPREEKKEEKGAAPRNYRLLRMLELAGIVPADREERSGLGVIPRLDTLELRTVRDLRLNFADGRATSLWIPVVRSGYSLLVGPSEEPSFSRNVVTPPDEEEEKASPEPKEIESAVALPVMEGEEEVPPEAAVEPKEIENAVVLLDEEKEEASLEAAVEL
ncbi:MAG: hypothetical protein LBL51_04045, partial [Synergistaceae bacterium]|nr:hypothetical protein [Synergistaceae bacterium]